MITQFLANKIPVRLQSLAELQNLIKLAGIYRVIFTL